jgi:hypothetical protein
MRVLGAVLAIGAAWITRVLRRKLLSRGLQTSGLRKRCGIVAVDA